MTLRVAMAQLNTVVGDVAGNVRRVLENAARARDELGARLVVFPELTISGYPPEDLLFHGNMRRSVERALGTLASKIEGITAVVGYPEYDGDELYNSVAVIRDGAVVANYRKQLLPNYGVFDEKRYFDPGTEPLVVDVDGFRCGVTVCEDVWGPGAARQSCAAGAELLLVINGSPFDEDHMARRVAVLRERAAETRVPIAYCNMVGGQDELVFDGGSMVIAADGTLTQRAPLFEECLVLAEFRREAGTVAPVPAEVSPDPGLVERVYGALVLGTRDYVNKHGFPGVVLGLSGGIDSALTLAIAVDALGADRVRAVMMPSRYTASISLEDAAEMARRIGVRYDVVSIEAMFETTLAGLAELFEGRPEDVTEENIQSRCRGIILMAISNKLGLMLLTTGNKSEMAVGYATLYGDMAGGFAPIKDCSKTLVFELARYRNGLSEVIPERIITRPPSAELREDQKDTDSLPPYDVLDPILEAFIEEDASVDDIVERGYDRATVGRVLGMVKRNEYKRRQAPPGIRISRRAFGRDWRYPITSGFDAG
jgi:NAD+ synthase (glutamine-hydrolysing)